MNVILFITIIVLLFIFGFSIITFGFKNRENFVVTLNNTLDTDVSFRNPNGNMLHFSRVDFHPMFESVRNKEYSQLQEFIPDLYNFKIDEDAGLMVDIENPINVSSVEYENLKKKLDFYRKQEKARLSKKNRDSKTNLILESRNQTPNYPIVRKEVTLLMMDRIVTDLINKHKFSEEGFKKNTGSETKIKFDKDLGLKIKNETVESFRFIKNWLLEEMSNEALKGLYLIKYTNSQRFKFEHDTIINYFVDYKNNLERFQFQAITFRNNKEHNFYVYFDVIFDYKFINYYINDIIILGINLEERLLFSKFLNKDYNLDSKGVHLSLSNDNPSYVTDNYINNYRKTAADFEKSKADEEQNLELNEKKRGYCFGKDSLDKDSCISYTPSGGVGIWDTPCKYNEECPFYKKNINYPNNRGGCKNGFCEMPVGINRLGYKEYNEGRIDNAVCYNCKKTDSCTGFDCNRCCEEQKDTRKYPNLKSPDYAFHQDYFERIKYLDDFEKKDLAPVNIIL